MPIRCISNLMQSSVNCGTQNNLLNMSNPNASLTNLAKNQVNTSLNRDIVLNTYNTNSFAKVVHVNSSFESTVGVRTTQKKESTKNAKQTHFMMMSPKENGCQTMKSTN